MKEYSHETNRRREVMDDLISYARHNNKWIVADPIEWETIDRSKPNEIQITIRVVEDGVEG